MAWQWNEALNRYQDSATGRILSNASVRDLINERQRISGAGSNNLAGMLAGGQLNTRDWEISMRQAIKTEYIQQYMLGKGGLSQMTQADWGSIGGMLADQYRYLGGFAQEVKAGQLSEAQVAARSKMYINSGREAYERAQRRTEGEANEVAWMLTVAEHCPDCIAFAQLGWQPIEPWPFVNNGNALPGSGNTQCLTNCQCHLEYRAKPDELPEDTPTELIDLLEEEPEVAPERGRRPLSPQETQAQSDLEEAAQVRQMMLDAGDTNGVDGMDQYIAALETSLSRESAANNALWDTLGIVPQDATPDDWKFVGEAIQSEAMELYRKYTREGITSDIAQRRGAKVSGWQSVGSEVIEVREGHFSRRTAQRLEGELWQQGKAEMSDAMGQLLQQAGFTSSEISDANFEQRQRLLAELGEKRVSTTSRGTPRKIDAVEPEWRERVTESVDYQTAAIAGNSAIDPLSLPTLDAYGKLELSDWIQATK